MRVPLTTTVVTVLAIVGCESRTSGTTVLPVVGEQASDAGGPTCTPLKPECQLGPARRPTRRRGDFLSTDGRVVHYYRQDAHFFDAKTLAFASAKECALHESVYAWDRRDVYVLSPQSCGGDNCGGDYTGYAWGGFGVVHPAAFRWLAAGYGADDVHVYHVRHAGPLQGASPVRFEVVSCGNDEQVLGRDGQHLYRDGEPINAALDAR